EILVFFLFFNFQKLPSVADAADKLWEHWQQNPLRVAGSLPVKLLGVWWMRSSPADEICLTFEGDTFDPQTRQLTSDFMQECTWTFGAHTVGYLSYVLLLLCGRSCLVYRFNETYAHASIKLYIWWVVPIPDCILKAELTQEDNVGDQFARRTWLFGQLHLYRCYTLRKVIDKSGNKVAVDFQQMESAEAERGRSGVQGIPRRSCTLWSPKATQVSSEKQPLTSGSA
ncbi:unnamed protein product, partial [Polarella glacialis]